MKKSSLQNLALLGGSCLFALFLFNAALVVLGGNPYDLEGNRLRAAKAQGITFDARSRFEVVRALRAERIDAYPVTHGAAFLRHGGNSVQTMNGKAFFPLGAIAHTMQVNCNESGEYALYRSDRYGFNNDDAVYEGEKPVLILGDSFAQGSCVRREDNVAGQLTRRGVTPINLGMGGSGPLLELAILREYGARLKPKKIFWLYYHYNDLDDLKNELRHPLLQQYLEKPDFSLGMAERQAEVDAYWKTEVEALMRAQEQTRPTPESPAMIMAKRIVTLKPLRVLLGQLTPVIAFKRQLTALGWNLRETPPEIEKLAEVLTQAQTFSRSIGADLYFVYLPGHMEFGDYPQNRDLVLKHVRALNIPVIDFRETLERQPDPLAVFPFRLIGHYTPEGYGLLAEQLSWHIGK